MNIHKTRWDRMLLSAVFFAVISLPAIGSFWHISPQIQINENRNLANKPDLKFDRSILTFPSEFQMYFNDHFGFREIFLRLEEVFKNKLLNVSIVKEKFTLGKDGWLFLGKEDLIKSRTPYSPDDLKSIKNIVEIRKTYFAQLNINYFMVVAPNAESIYPEYLPDSLQSVKKTNRYDQLYSYLKSTSSQNTFIDVKAVLQRNKAFILPQQWIDKLGLTANTAKVYYKTDIHWTYLGSYLAFNEILSRLKAYYPWLDPVPLSCFKLIPARKAHGRRISQWLPMPENNYNQRFILELPDNFDVSKWPQIKKYPGFHQINILFVDDSMLYYFMLDWFKPPLFKVRSLYKKTGKDIVLKEIAKEKPDVLIEEVTERGMDGLFYRPAN